jgi:predicted O-methyltransferase YrrM
MADYYITKIKEAYETALKEESKLCKEILALDGMSGKLTRHFYNAVCSAPDTRYLEIGTWKGSSICSAMYKNTGKFICIDNFSDFASTATRLELFKNLDTFRGDTNVTFIEENAFEVDVAELPKFNIYLYDGDHAREAHAKALTHYISCLDDTFIYLVDDWNWSLVRDGTYDAIKELGLKTAYFIEVRTTMDDTHPEVGDPGRIQWHNGIGIFVLQKTT